MSIRSEFFKHYGPMLDETICLLFLDEINILRVHAGLPKRTPVQALTALENKRLTVQEYYWMKEE